MRRRTTEPPPEVQFGYCMFSAANPDGDAAFLLSVKRYIFTYIAAIIDGLVLLRALAYRQARLFLFSQITDKPSRRGLPRCRSPPFLFTAVNR